MKKGLLLFFVLFVLSVSAKVKMPSVFSDNMVLQQLTNAPVWGVAKPGADIKVTVSWDGKTYKTKADANGSWMLKIATPKAGGPFTLTVSDGKPVIFSNVMIGEVWLCTGQSNMEMPVVGPANSGWGKVNNYEAEKAEAQNHPNIRLLMVTKTISLAPKTDVQTDTEGWQECSSNTIGNFSAAGYFFGRNLEKYRNVPIGLIETCWGGTPVEAWTSVDALQSVPYYKDKVEKIKAMPTDEKEIEANNQRQYEEWVKTISATDPGLKGSEALWAASDFNDSQWRSMSVPCNMCINGLNGFNGIVWFRKTVDIPKSWSGKELTISLGAIDDHDVTYFNGTEIGKTAGCRVLRYYTVPAKLVKSGKAVVTVMCIDSGGEGGFMGGLRGMKLYKKGKDTIDISGEWKYMATIPSNKFKQRLVFPNKYQSPTVLFNGMINPIIPYAVKGAIWYQGEANAGHAYLYRETLPTMINDWRTRWGYNFPFYIVQLANYMKKQTAPEESGWAELREAQLKTLAMDNTGMAVAIDIGNADDIHPKNKQEVGRRLSLAARKITYGENIPYSGPMYSKYQIEGSTIRIFFDCCDSGLKADDGQQLTGFTIAGADHKFYWADAKIDGNTIVVSSKDVTLPLAVRYAWANNPVCNLYNGAGLPASPFRTDDWPGVTFNR